VDDFNRAGSFSVCHNVNGDLQSASRRRNSKRFQAGLHQIKRRLRQGLAVGDRSLSACFLSQFQRIHFSSHEPFTAIHVPEKYGPRLAFVDDFGAVEKGV
jgi:hypothetical protein